MACLFFGFEFVYRCCAVLVQSHAAVLRRTQTEPRTLFRVVHRFIGGRWPLVVLVR